MESCDQWLACDDIEERIVVTHTNLGNGLGKSFSRASLDGTPGKKLESLTQWHLLCNKENAANSECLSNGLFSECAQSSACQGAISGQKTPLNLHSGEATEIDF